MGMRKKGWGDELIAVAGVILLVAVVISLVGMVEAVVERMQAPVEVKSEGATVRESDYEPEAGLQEDDCE
jgi:hypothetical protein